MSIIDYSRTVGQGATFQQVAGVQLLTLERTR